MFEAFAKRASESTYSLTSDGRVRALDFQPTAKRGELKINLYVSEVKLYASLDSQLSIIY